MNETWLAGERGAATLIQSIWHYLQVHGLFPPMRTNRGHKSVTAGRENPVQQNGLGSISLGTLRDSHHTHMYYAMTVLCRPLGAFRGGRG